MNKPIRVSALFLLLIMLAACAGGPATPKPTVEGIPTPQGVFAQTTAVLTPLPAAPTVAPAESGDPVAGKTVYDNKCASCHGAQGEGVEGKGKGVAGWTMSAAEFEDILRTGGKGKLGNDHLYGLNQISPSGMQNLFAYVRSLQKK
ncbi:MAG: cytochrome c [Anaerolineae bacterium]|nr:cytochrome c [Anaerolineae bacterium]